MDNTKEFIKTINNNYENWCDANEVEPNNQLFLQYLIDRNLIEKKTVKRFVVINNYPEALANNLGIKKAALWELEAKTGVNYKTIDTWIARFQSWFKPSFK